MADQEPVTKTPDTGIPQTPAPEKPAEPIRSLVSGWAVKSATEYRQVAIYGELNVGEFVLSLEEFMARMGEDGKTLDLTMHYPFVPEQPPTQE